MFDVDVKDEEIIMKLVTTREVTNKEVLANFVGNLLTRAGGDIASKVNIILTKEKLYLEYRGHVAIGYEEETRDVIKIELQDLKSFVVTNKEDKEFIEIQTPHKAYYFIRNNQHQDHLALAMSKVLQDIK